LRTPHNGFKHILCRFNVDAGHAARRGQAHRAGHQGHIGAGFTGCARNGKTHLAARQVGDAAHRVDGLVGGAGRDQHMLAGQRFGRKESNHVFKNLLGLQHAAVAGLAAGLETAAHTQHRGAIGIQLNKVALRGRMRVHLTVHGRRHQQRHLVDGTGQAHQAQQVVGAAVQQLGHEVGAHGRDQDGVALRATG
jgi:hypothetical protein